MFLTKLLTFAFLFHVSCSGAPRNGMKLKKEFDPRLVRLLLSNDFESGNMEPWYDESPGETHWTLETLNSSQEPTPAPTPQSGQSYLRIDRPEGYASGLGVLYTPLWTANPGDKLTLSFWIRSRHTQGNTLDVYWINGTREEKLLGLSSFSSSSNNQWRTAEAIVPVSVPTNTKLVIYGYCGPNEEDAIAIDNILVGAANLTTTTSVPTTAQLTETTTTWSSYGTTSSPIGCQNQLTGEYGYFGSPVNPSTGTYYDGMSCSWTITVPSYFDRLMIDFSRFQTESSVDTVRVYDGPSTADHLLLEHSGDTLPYPVYCSSNQALVTFTTDSSITLGGFYGYYAGYHTANFSNTFRE